MKVSTPSPLPVTPTHLVVSVDGGLGTAGSAAMVQVLLVLQHQDGFGKLAARAQHVHVDELVQYLHQVRIRMVAVHRRFVLLGIVLRLRSQFITEELGNNAIHRANHFRKVRSGSVKGVRDRGSVHENRLNTVSTTLRLGLQLGHLVTIGWVVAVTDIHERHLLRIQSERTQRGHQSQRMRKHVLPPSLPTLLPGNTHGIQPTVSNTNEMVLFCFLS